MLNTVKVNMVVKLLMSNLKKLEILQKLSSIKLVMTRNWEMDGVSKNDLNSYIYPDVEEIEKVDVKILYFGYFHQWSMFENYNYIKNKIDFRSSENRTCGTFTDFDSLDDKFDDIYYYLQYIKFGFGRCVRDTSRLIQNGHMKRDEALKIMYEI